RPDPCLRHPRNPLHRLRPLTPSASASLQLPASSPRKSRPLEKAKAPGLSTWGFQRVGGDLLSHTDDRAVPSALEGLTAEFGMGSGVTPPVKPPETLSTRMSD